MEELLKIRLSPRNYFEYLKIIGSGLFELTDSERRCLAAFMELKYDFNENHPFSHENKKKVSKSLNYNNNTINVYIKKLKDKRAILETDSGYDFNPNLKPFRNVDIELNWQKY